MRTEVGIHRLVRNSPFGTNGRHTSFASVSVSPIVKDRTVVILPHDLKIESFRSSGPGGQSVNKTDSAIRITHLPSKITVQCQNERSQTRNREIALQLLSGKLAALQQAEEDSKKVIIRQSLGKNSFGDQIRSYVLNPYTLVKDVRTGLSSSNTEDILAGNIETFVDEALVGSIQSKMEMTLEELSE